MKLSAERAYDILLELEMPKSYGDTFLHILEHNLDEESLDFILSEIYDMLHRVKG